MQIAYGKVIVSNSKIQQQRIFRSKDSADEWIRQQHAIDQSAPDHFRGA